MGCRSDEQDEQWQGAYDEAYADVQAGGPYDSMADFVGWLPYWLGTAAVDGQGDVSAAADVLEPWAERTGGELQRIEEGDGSPSLILESCTE